MVITENKMCKQVTEEEIIKAIIIEGNILNQEKKIRRDFKDEQDKLDQMSESEKEKHFRDLANGK